MPLCVFSLMASSASAQNSSQKPRQLPRKVTRPQAPPLVINPAPVVDESSPGRTPKSFYVSAFYNTGSSIKYSGQVNLFGQNTDYTATETGTGTVGVSLGYSRRLENSFGFESEVAYELPRTSKGLTGKAGNLTITGTVQDGTRQLHLAYASLSGNYTIGNRFTVFAGLNYPLTIGGDYDLKPLPGYQLGLGTALSDVWAVDLSYRSFQMKGSFSSGATVLEVKKAEISGLALALKYFFR